MRLAKLSRRLSDMLVETLTSQYTIRDQKNYIIMNASSDDNYIMVLINDCMRLFKIDDIWSIHKDSFSIIR
ncbi:hypothetical protein DSUL_80075 [Desulfovibrionales bacterium]